MIGKVEMLEGGGQLLLICFAMPCGVAIRRWFTTLVKVLAKNFHHSLVMGMKDLSRTACDDETL